MVIGSEPQIYFYADRRSASGYVYMYPMMENHDFALKMQQEMIREIESARPEVLVMVDIYGSWLIQDNSYRHIFKWLPSYQKQYRLVGLVELTKEGPLYYWEQGIELPPKSPYWIAVMKRIANS